LQKFHLFDQNPDKKPRTKPMLMPRTFSTIYFLYKFHLFLDQDIAFDQDQDLDPNINIDLSLDLNLNPDIKQDLDQDLDKNQKDLQFIFCKKFILKSTNV
jgi:hypothetical protein